MMMNGHPTRWRTEWGFFGLNEASVSLFKLLGRNMVYYQNNPGFWFGSWYPDIVYIPQQELDLLDRSGIAVLMPLPTCQFFTDAQMDDPTFQQEYAALLEKYMRFYRRHPAILGWCTALNAINPREGIHSGHSREAQGSQDVRPLQKSRH